jgi:hypothetical protein
MQLTLSFLNYIGYNRFTLTKAENAMSLSKYATPNERAIVQVLLNTILDDGCTVSVYDGEEMTVFRSTDIHVIKDALATTGEDYLHVWKNGKIGWVRLIWSNDTDLISDSSMGEIERLLKPAMDFAETLM